MAFLTIVDVSPGVVRFNYELVTVKHSEAVHDMSAERGVDVAWQVFAYSLPVCGDKHLFTRRRDSTKISFRLL